MKKLSKSLEPLKSEIWKDVKDFEGYYQISNKGRIKSLGRNIPVNGGVKFQPERILSTCYSKQGYAKSVLCVDNVKKYVSVHSLVAVAFLPNPDNKPQVNHKNSRRWDNRVENLEWCTAQENIQHAANKGRLACTKGSNNGAATITESAVFEIREKYATRNYYFKELAEEYGQTFQNISLIVRGKIWSNVGGPISEYNRSKLNKRYQK